MFRINIVMTTPIASTTSTALPGTPGPTITIASEMPHYIVQLCAYCQHDHGVKFRCPKCSRFTELWYIREGGERVYCSDCKIHFVGPIVDMCDHSNQTDDEIDPDHECQYEIRSGTEIHEINPETKRITRRYVLTQSQEILPNNIVMDWLYNRDHLTVCRYCRFLPDLDLDDWPGLVDYLELEARSEILIWNYYQMFPNLKLALPETTRHGEGPIQWLEKLRVYAYREIQRRLSRLTLPVHHDVAVAAEQRLYKDLMDKFNQK
jgi:hypothetical protein